MTTTISSSLFAGMTVQQFEKHFTELHVESINGEPPIPDKAVEPNAAVTVTGSQRSISHIEQTATRVRQLSQVLVERFGIDEQRATSFTIDRLQRDEYLRNPQNELEIAKLFLEDR